jgi:hypothetical protein
MARARFCTKHDRHVFETAGGALGEDAGGFGGVAGRGDDRLGVEGSGRADDRPEIMRVGDLVEHENQTRRDLVEFRGGQGIDFGIEPLMYGIRG